MNQGTRNRNKVREASHALKEEVQWVLAGKEAAQQLHVGKEENQWAVEGKESAQCPVFVNTGLVNVVTSWVQEHKLLLFFVCLQTDLSRSKKRKKERKAEA